MNIPGVVLISILSLIFIFYPSAMAIVNVETLRVTKGQGTRHVSELKGNGAGGNSENFRASLGHATAWTRQEDQIFLVLDYTYGESSKIKDTNKFFSHVRLARQLQRPTSQVEQFFQWQYNEFQRLNSRFLAGAGWREALIKKEGLSLHAGLGAFWYFEEISSEGILPGESDEGGRWNSYLALQWRADEKVRLFNTVYFQPRMNYLKDHNVLWDFQFHFKVTDRLAITLNWAVGHDNTPPSGIKSTDSSYKVGLKLSY